MLHSSDRYVLDDYLIPWLKENGYATITYADLLGQLLGNRVPHQKEIILTIDDIAADYVQADFTAMVKSLHNHGMVAALSVNTTVPLNDVREKYDILRLWHSWGFEMNDHTVNHQYLPNLAEDLLDFQIGEAAIRIKNAVGESPPALVLPFGSLNDQTGKPDQRIFDVADRYGIAFVVGIVGGRKLPEDGEFPIYLGRTNTEGLFKSAVFNIEHWAYDQPSCQ